MLQTLQFIFSEQIRNCSKPDPSRTSEVYVHSVHGTQAVKIIITRGGEPKNLCKDTLLRWKKNYTAMSQYNKL